MGIKKQQRCNNYLVVKKKKKMKKAILLRTTCSKIEGERKKKLGKNVGKKKKIGHIPPRYAKGSFSQMYSQVVFHIRTSHNDLEMG